MQFGVAECCPMSVDERVAARRALYVEEFSGIEAEHRRNLTPPMSVRPLMALSTPGLIKQARVACRADAERRMAYGIE